MYKLVVLYGILITFICFTATSNASILTVYTDETLWKNALCGNFMTEDFADSQLNSGVSFVSSESGHINPAGEYYQDVLMSGSQNEPMTTWFFDPQIKAFGGYWTLGGPGGSGNSLLVYLADSSLYVGSISNSYGGEFWGFISDTRLTSIKLIGGNGDNQQNYQLDNMVYSQIPEPAIISLLAIAGLVKIRCRCN
ncbi:MAG: hypothetical protein A2Y12_19525 [Planctomycetes bacterium GWF2_42_9]|nr:MAG: hypothetical protein A2Y12_19525 [Planctomycetes bacterium GWF2_42_9]